MKSKNLQLETVERLTRLSEAELQRKIIEPLLRAEGYTNVRETGGANDKGKDLVATKEDFGKPKLYAIQIKKFRFSGKHNSRQGLANVITQLKQALDEPVKDPLTKTERRADRCIFITPFEIDRDALESAFYAVSELERREVTIIDGPLLVDMISKRIPTAFAGFDMELHYKFRLAETFNKIPEFRAFGVAQEIELRALYVDADLTDRESAIVNVATSDADTAPQVVIGNAAEFHHLEAQCAVWGDGKAIYPDVSKNIGVALQIKEERHRIKLKIQDVEEKLASRKAVLSRGTLEPIREIEADETAGSLKRDLGSLDSLDVRYVDITPIVKLIRQDAAQVLDCLERLGMAGLSADECTVSFQKLIAFSSRFDGFNEVKLLSSNWPFLWKSVANTRIKHPRIHADSIAKARVPIFVRGPAGAGKTTLLRHLCRQHGAEHTNSATALPVFISLVRVKISSAQDIFDTCLQQLRDLNFLMSEVELASRLALGGIKLLFDGLDETGERSESVFTQIKLFSKDNPSVPIVVTGRDTYTYSKWPEAAQLRVNPFSTEALNRFVTNWFTSEPTKVRTVTSWFAANERIRDAACTPIVAALLCSLVGADADLPSTEVELYEQRFELLLGRWEKAKGVASISAALRKRYWHFLTTVAFALHIETRRTIDSANLLQHANRFYDAKYHGNASNFVTDCIHRGLLFQEPADQLSFGHLTYQEFLVAKHLAQDNPIDIILHRIDQPWWSKALDFYAALKGDITEIAIRSIAKPRSDNYLKKVIDMCNQTALTPKEARDRVMMTYIKPYDQVPAIVERK